MDRLSWDEVWTQVVRSISSRSYDPRHKVGAIVVSFDNTQLLSMGYNGNYSGGPNEAESLEPGHSGMLHAEINALLKMDYHSPCKKRMYITLSPCRMCAKAIINAGIDEVVFIEKYRDASGIELLNEAGIYCRQVT